MGKSRFRPYRQKTIAIRFCVCYNIITMADLFEQQEEHILVCLSTSPSNGKIVETAAKMAKAFGGTLTALYVQTPESEKMGEEDRMRLQNHIRLAEQAGATVTTVYGEDVSFQIAEFARLSRVSKIVIGRSSIKRRHFWGKPALTEKLTEIAPNLDIHIIPDSAAENKYRMPKGQFTQYFVPSWKDLLLTALLLGISTGLGYLFWASHFTEANVITVYILGVLLTAILTKSYISCIIGSLGSVLLFNFLFIEPLFTFEVGDAGSYLTFAVMLIASLITGMLANRLKNSAKQSAQTAYRTKVLFDTNQLLQKEKRGDDVINITANQLMKLMEREIVVYPVIDGRLGAERIFGKNQNEELFLNERNIAEWVFEHKKHAGATTEAFPNAKCLYLAVRINERIYGVVGVLIDGKPLDSLENSVLLSILGECALAIDNIRNAEEKESAAVLAQNEQLRANLLRTISHDLRTPLTSISGNAEYLLSSYDKLDDESLTQVFTDIYDDSMWLIGLVENLLSITRIEEGRVNLKLSCELAEEVIEEALRHINRRSKHYHISVDIKDDLLMAKMDVKLILQVIINLVDNAIKYTPVGTTIVISAEKCGNEVRFSVADDGEGIEDEIKSHVFEMFFTGGNKIADSRRSLGLGLALCKSIVNVHGGELTLEDNLPHGSIFSFTLPLEEVNVNE